MALIVEDGTGRSDADSLVSVAEADAYLSGRGVTPSSWSSANEATKEQWLRRGSQNLTTMTTGKWKGEKLDADQAFPVPRVGLTDEDDYRVDSNEVPVRSKHAAIELAAMEAGGTELYAQDGADGGISAKTIKAGSVTIAKQYSGSQSARVATERVWDLLRPYLVPDSRIYRA